MIISYHHPPWPLVSQDVVRAVLELQVCNSAPVLGWFYAAVKRHRSDIAFRLVFITAYDPVTLCPLRMTRLSHEKLALNCLWVRIRETHCVSCLSLTLQFTIFNVDTIIDELIEPVGSNVIMREGGTSLGSPRQLFDDFFAQ